MRTLPRTCLTCKFAYFVDDELEVLYCFEPEACRSWGNPSPVSDTHVCDAYELNKTVKADADQGCW
jgi:hypothetical protein